MKLSCRNIRNFKFLLILLIITILIISSPAFCTSRGIHIISEQGNDLYFYNDYHALVIGVSNYEKWPKLPYATKDAEKMVNYTRGKQHPQYGKINNPDLDRGDFIFAPVKTAPPSESPKYTRLKENNNIKKANLIFDDSISDLRNWNIGLRKGGRTGKGGFEKVFLDESQGADESQVSIAMVYKLGSERVKKHKNRKIVARIRNDLNRNLSMYSGIDFFIKGTAGLKLRFLVSDKQDDSKDMENWYFDFILTENWSHMRIDFTDLSLQRGKAKLNNTNMNLDLDKIIIMAWVINEMHNKRGARGKVWIDKIAFY